ncbi:hypothetical protein IFM89_039585 [Coptis chinensis]|uniref:Ferredoxin thioredoxin reductase alpha chain domain-containing protein n=1 Tax=Coptis chinensis TaxID=261450 RepID=A0A835GUV9_9MAGN|nr:hypothetical protein IFM89_039585 [Coptis chinensis]
MTTAPLSISSSSFSYSPSPSSVFNTSCRSRGIISRIRITIPRTSATVVAKSQQHFTSSSWIRRGRRSIVSCEVALKADSPSEAAANSEESKIGARVRVKVPLKVYHVPKVPELDLSGMEGELKQYVGFWKGKHISANLPFKVQFFAQVPDRDGPVKFLAHLKEDELVTVSSILHLLGGLVLLCLSIAVVCYSLDGEGVVRVLDLEVHSGVGRDYLAQRSDLSFWAKEMEIFSGGCSIQIETNVIAMETDSTLFLDCYAIKSCPRKLQSEGVSFTFKENLLKYESDYCYLLFTNGSYLCHVSNYNSKRKRQLCLQLDLLSLGCVVHSFYMLEPAVLFKSLPFPVVVCSTWYSGGVKNDEVLISTLQ